MGKIKEWAEDQPKTDVEDSEYQEWLDTLENDYAICESPKAASQAEAGYQRPIRVRKNLGRVDDSAGFGGANRRHRH